MLIAPWPRPGSIEMLVTLTPDPVLDKAFFIPSWTPGVPMRATRKTVSVGGKGLDASVALSHLGVSSLAFCFLAGDTGAQLLTCLNGYGFQVVPIWGEGETRTALIVVEEDHQRHSHLFSGELQITPGNVTALIEALQPALVEASWLICGGILPACLDRDFFARITDLAHQQTTPVLIDSFGPHLRSALAARPEIVKMNWDEFDWTFEKQTPDLETLMASARQAQQDYDLQALVITCGAQGLLGLTGEGTWRARPPAQTVVNAAGAGDAASGTLAWRLASGESWPEALRWAAAAGAAVVLTENTADLLQSDFDRILPQVIIEQVD
jgi:1-phosphofructokinase family hexose kinase